MLHHKVKKTVTLTVLTSALTLGTILPANADILPSDGNIPSPPSYTKVDVLCEPPVFYKSLPSPEKITLNKEYQTQCKNFGTIYTAKRDSAWADYYSTVSPYEVQINTTKLELASALRELKNNPKDPAIIAKVKKIRTTLNSLTKKYRTVEPAAMKQFKTIDKTASTEYKNSMTKLKIWYRQQLALLPK